MLLAISAGAGGDSYEHTLRVLDKNPNPCSRLTSTLVALHAQLGVGVGTHSGKLGHRDCSYAGGVFRVLGRDRVHHPPGLGTQGLKHRGHVDRDSSTSGEVRRPHGGILDASPITIHPYRACGAHYTTL